jgi:hypothetical protein
MSKKVEVDFALLQCLSFLASRSAIAITSDITDEQARKFIADGLDEVYDGMHDKKINFSEYSDDDLKNIGFVQHEDLMLVPIHILPLLSTGTELHSVQGEQVTAGIDRLDLETRFNCIPYGFKRGVKQDEEETLHTH